MVIFHDVSFIVLIRLGLRQGSSINILKACSGFTLLAARILLPQDGNAGSDSPGSKSWSSIETSIKEAGGYIPLMQKFWPLMHLIWPKGLLQEKLFAGLAIAANLAAAVLATWSPYLLLEFTRLAEALDNPHDIMIAFFKYTLVEYSTAFLSSSVRDTLWQSFGTKRDNLAKENIFTRVMGFNARFHHDNKSDSLATRCDDCTNITTLFDSFVFDALSHAVRLVRATRAIASMYGLHTAMIQLAAIVFEFIIRDPMMRLVMRIIDQVREADETTKNLRRDRLECWKTVFVNNKLFHTIKAYTERLEEEMDLSRKFNMYNNVGRAVDLAVVVSGEMLAMYLVLSFVINSESVDKKTVSTFISFSRLLLSSSLFFVGFYKKALSNFQGADRLRKLLEAGKPVVYGTKKLELVRCRIRFDKVSFSYDDKQEKVISDVSFECQRGEMIALIGPSGSGKSTIAELGVGVIQPTEGSISIDGQDIKDLAPGELTSHIAYQQQHPHMLDGTFAFNIGYGVFNATESEIQSAAREVGIDTAIEKLPQKYNTECNSSDGTLSGGQKQRVAAARTLLRIRRGAEIVVLDEATSALDTNAEAQVMDSFEKASANCTRVTPFENHREG
ncbi:hypothetical protein ACHAP4_011288 [Fusarium culmorum]